MDFNIKNLWSFNIGGTEFWITETIRNTWIIMGVLIIFAIIVRFKLNNFKEIPKGFQNVIELIIEAFDGMVKGSAGERFMHLGNWFFAVFALILCSNLSGIFFLRPPTADWATTFACAFATFIIIQAFGAYYRKGAYLKDFITPNPVFLPLNLIGELARPISLSFRLFGNVLAGMILIQLYYSLTPFFVQLGLPIVLHGFFDLFAGALQTYIFVVLSMTFIGAMASTDE